MLQKANSAVWGAMFLPCALTLQSLLFWRKKQARETPKKARVLLFAESLKFFEKLSVLKRCVPKTLAFAFGLRSRSKTRCFKTRVLGRRLPNGKPQERLRFRGLRSKTLAFKKRIAIIFCDVKTSLGARACV